MNTSNSQNSTVSRELADRSAVVQLPALLWGGNPAGIASATGWQLTALDEAAGRYSIRVSERRRRKRAHLVEPFKMGHAGNSASPGTFARLRNLPAFHPMDPATTRLISGHADSMVAGDDRLPSRVSAAVLRMQTCAREDLPQHVRSTLTEILLPRNPEASTWLIRMRPELSMRFSLLRALLMVEADPGLLARSTNSDPGMVFRGAQGLLGDTTLGLDAYLAPLLLAQSPWLSGVAVPRNGGVVVLMFGELIRGNSGVASELLQLFHPNDGRLREPPTPVAAASLEAAFRWWVTQLDSLFTEATDPCNYRRADQTFDIRAQFETFLGLEQAFRNLQSILASNRDANIGRMACFDTMDTLEGLHVGLDFREMSKLSVAERSLGEIREAMPKTVCDVLLPKAEAAVAALRELQDGFFDSPNRTAAGLMLPNKHGVSVETSLSDATAEWLRLLRNAGHSFKSRGGGAGTRSGVLLMSHDGRVPSDLNGLAYLYLLRLVTRPNLLRDVRSARQPP